MLCLVKELQSSNNQLVDLNTLKPPHKILPFLQFTAQTSISLSLSLNLNLWRMSLSSMSKAWKVCGCLLASMSTIYPIILFPCVYFTFLSLLFLCYLFIISSSAFWVVVFLVNFHPIFRIHEILINTD